MREVSKFTLYGREHRLSINDIFSNGVNVTVRLGWYDGDKWVYIYSEEINQTATTSKEGTDEELKRIVEILNKKANELWGDDTPEPQSGVPRIIWLIENKVYVEGNEIKVKIDD